MLEAAGRTAFAADDDDDGAEADLASGGRAAGAGVTAEGAAAAGAGAGLVRPAAKGDAARRTASMTRYRFRLSSSTLSMCAVVFLNRIGLAHAQRTGAQPSA